MFTNQFILSTTKETPAEATLVSHQLMLRAGLIQQLGVGLYTWLPLGLRVLQRVEAVVREEMDRIGALAMLMPSVQPASLWEASGRWHHYGPELLRLMDRHGRDYCYGPTHEEVVVHSMAAWLKSYKQLPLSIYQVQTKFRDEVRPRFGVMRSREFVMKDAYSFHLDSASLEATYEAMYGAYVRIFDRLGLTYRPVLADTGAIGGEYSHEFQVLAEAGEDCIVTSDASDYAANIELADARWPDPAKAPGPEAPLCVSFDTPAAKTIAALEAEHQVAPDQGVKTLVFHGAEGGMVALVLRGDHELNPVRLTRLPTLAQPPQRADEAEVQAALGVSVGSLGVVNLSIPMIVDPDAAALSDFVCGANRDGVHYAHVHWGRDAVLGPVHRLRLVCEGDPSPDGVGRLVFSRGIEVGQVFQLGDRYTQKMNMTVLDDQGKAVHPLMGCYGIGVSRVVAAAIEQHHDDRGIRWPAAMAPFSVVIVPMQYHKSYRVRESVQALYEALSAQGVSVLVDDRKARPGVLFADMDLIGIPHRWVVGERGIDAGTLEYKGRSDAEAVDWPMETAVAQLVALLSDAPAFARDA
jgi:prolyl-tRNA synthetase